MIIKGNRIIIFCDGASKGNPGPGGFGAIIIDGNKVMELSGFEKNTTNNRMELSGALTALKEVSKEKGEILVYTDSKYLINGMTGWIYGWQKNGWQTKEKKDVLNKDLWEKLVKLAKGKSIKWNYVGGHVGVAGNERCDEIASGFAIGDKVVLYKGPLSKYKIDVLNLGHNRPVHQNGHPALTKAGKGKNVKAHSYLSLVGGILNIDKTWMECEKRVKGKAEAKYKKSISEANEKEIIKTWGLNE